MTATRSSTASVTTLDPALEASRYVHTIPAMSTFAAALEFADKLPLDDQEELAHTLSRRVAEQRRREILTATKEARAEFARGKLKPRSAAEIMKLIRA